MLILRAVKDSSISISIEHLEPRIAPAVFYVSGAGLKIVDASGNSVNDAASAALTGAIAAVDLHGGDSLVYDPSGAHNGNGDVPLVTVTSGAAIVFWADTNGNGKFDLNEIVGLACSADATATISTEIHGVITAGPLSEAAGSSTGSSSVPGVITIHLPGSGLTNSGVGTPDEGAGGSISIVSLGAGNPITIIGAGATALGSGGSGGTITEMSSFHAGTGRDPASGADGVGGGRLDNEHHGRPHLIPGHGHRAPGERG